MCVQIKRGKRRASLESSSYPIHGCDYEVSKQVLEFNRLRWRSSQAFPMVQLPQLMASIATIKLTKVITLSIMTQFLSNVFGFRISSKTPHYIELSHFSFSENGSFIHIFKIFLRGDFHALYFDPIHPLHRLLPDSLSIP